MLLSVRDKVCELVSLTHQWCDTLVSDNERVVVTGNARSVGPSTMLSHSRVLPAPPASRQCRFSAASTGLTLAQRWPHLLSALLLPGVGLHLCYVTYSTFMTGGPEEGGLWGGGYTYLVCTFLCSLYIGFYYYRKSCEAASQLLR